MSAVDKISIKLHLKGKSRLNRPSLLTDESFGGPHRYFIV